MKADWFGPRLQELRTAKGWTQQQLADAAGLAVGVVRKLERRENKPTWETALALADALGVSCEAFVQQPAERAPAGPGRPRKTVAEAAPTPSTAVEREAAGKTPPIGRRKGRGKTGGR
jgi:transcriptional regulator with XRE-family HTH domain